MARKFYIQDNVLLGEPVIKFDLTQPVHYSEITDPIKIKELYLIQYKYRIRDGKEYVLDFTASTYINVLSGVYSEIEAFELETHIKDLSEQLNNGLWLTAQNTNANLSLSGIYTQELKDSIQVDLDEYVAANY